MRGAEPHAQPNLLERHEGHSVLRPNRQPCHQGGERQQVREAKRAGCWAGAGLVVGAAPGWLARRLPHPSGRLPAPPALLLRYQLAIDSPTLNDAKVRYWATTTEYANAIAVSGTQVGGWVGGWGAARGATERQTVAAAAAAARASCIANGPTPGSMTQVVTAPSHAGLVFGRWNMMYCPLPSHRCSLCHL